MCAADRYRHIFVYQKDSKHSSICSFVMYIFWRTTHSNDNKIAKNEKNLQKNCSPANGTNNGGRKTGSRMSLTPAVGQKIIRYAFVMIAIISMRYACVCVFCAGG